jgi:hypothetical protein
VCGLILVDTRVLLCLPGAAWGYVRVAPRGTYIHVRARAARVFYYLFFIFTVYREFKSEISRHEAEL